MRKLILAAASVAALALAGRRGAVGDHHQVQPRGGFEHAEGPAPKSSRNSRRNTTDGKSQGREKSIRIRTLYKTRKNWMRLQLARTDAGAPNSKFGPIGVREFEVFDLPYILPDSPLCAKSTDGPPRKTVQLLEPKGHDRSWLTG